MRKIIGIFSLLLSAVLLFAACAQTIEVTDVYPKEKIGRTITRKTVCL